MIKKVIPIISVHNPAFETTDRFTSADVAEDHRWTFNQRGMDFTKDLNLKGKYCYHPFNTITVDGFGDVYMCICQAWLPISVGKIWEFESLDAIGQSPKAKEIQTSILDGSYRYCDHKTCSIIQEGELSNKIDHKPQTINWINFALDSSCNLSCPSCRKEFTFINDGPKFDIRIQIVDHLIKLIENHSYYLKFTLSGDGDPFASLVYRHLLTNLDLTKHPVFDENGVTIDSSLLDKTKVKDSKLIELRHHLIQYIQNGKMWDDVVPWDDSLPVFNDKVSIPKRTVEIEIITNGILLKDHWNKLEKTHKNIVRTKISFDAGTESIYEVTRKGGSWSKLLESAKFLSKWKQKTYSDMILTANFVVQTANYVDMPAYVELCDQLGFDEINFQKIVDWGTFNNFNAEAVWKETHPEYKFFLNILRSLNNSKINYTNLTEIRYETQ